MREKVTVVIIHGAYGNPEENWFPWLATEVEKIGHRALVPAFPTPEGQDPDAWRQVFEAEVGHIDGAMILVGHSLAPAFILSLLESASQPAKGTFLVSGFLGLLGLEDFDPINEAFVCREFDWRRVRENAGVVHVYNSDNDPYVPLDRGSELARNLGVDVTIIPGGRHINSSAGFNSFEQLWNDVRELVESG